MAKRNKKVYSRRRIARKIKYLSMAILFLFTTGCSLATIILAALTINAGSSFSVSYEAGPPTNDLWNASRKKFILDNFNTVLQKIDSNSSVDNMATIDLYAEERRDAVALAENGFNEDTVELGGYQWHPVYLSQDENQNAVLTLWMSNPAQLAGKPYGDGPAFDANGAALWASSDIKIYSGSSNYPPTMYGTSYMRSVVLNNGGQFLEGVENVFDMDSGEVSVKTTMDAFTKNSNSVFAPFTMENMGMTDYIVTPEHMPWQKEGECISGEGNLPNENWSAVADEEIFTNSNFGFDNTDRTAYEAWKSDYLWLPSISEFGVIGTGRTNSLWDVAGTIWGQKSNWTELFGTNGAWSRSGDSRGRGISIMSGVGRVTLPVRSGREPSVCPALHLNLTKIAESLR